MTKNDGRRSPYQEKKKRRGKEACTIATVPHFAFILRREEDPENDVRNPAVIYQEKKKRGQKATGNTTKKYHGDPKMMPENRSNDGESLPRKEEKGAKTTRNTTQKYHDPEMMSENGGHDVESLPRKEEKGANDKKHDAKIPRRAAKE
jgi:hypothetical protein